MAVLVVAAFACGAGYLISLRIWPETKCGRCDGSGRNAGSNPHPRQARPPLTGRVLRWRERLAARGLFAWELVRHAPASSQRMCQLI